MKIALPFMLALAGAMLGAAYHGLCGVSLPHLIFRCRPAFPQILKELRA